MRLQSGRVYEQEWAPLSHAYGKVANSLLHIDDTADITIHDIRARARRLKAQVGLDMVVVDYLQLMGAAQRGENRNLEVAAISRGLKILAKDLAIPVVVLSQLSRSCEARADKRPTLADLRDSGAIEQDADLVVFIYRDEVYDNGPIGVVRVGFERSQTRFYNLDTVHEGAV
jgi:replicative DNA helicase